MSNNELLRERVCKQIIRFFYARRSPYARSYLKIDGSMAYAPACGHEPRCIRGSKCPYWIAQNITPEVVYQHLASKTVQPFPSTIGTYGIGPGNLANWICLDVDGHKKGELEAARATVKRLFVTLLSQEIPCYLEDSGRGFHIWIFSLGMEAKTAYRAGKFIVKESTDLLCPVEVYPKQFSTDSFGNLVKVPLGMHYSGKRCYFLDPVTWEVIPNQYTDVLLTIKEVPEERLLTLAGKYQEPRLLKVLKPSSQQQDGEIYDGPPCVQRMWDARLSEGEGRNNILFQQAVDLRRAGFNRIEAVKDLLWQWNLKQIDPLSQQEFDNTVEHAFESRYSYGCEQDYMARFCTREVCPIDRHARQREDEELNAELRKFAYTPYQVAAVGNGR